MTDLFNPFSLEFLGALEHLGGAMGVIYVGQLGFVETRLVNFPKFDEILPHFLYDQILHRRKIVTKGL